MHRAGLARAQQAAAPESGSETVLQPAKPEAGLEPRVRRAERAQVRQVSRPHPAAEPALQPERLQVETEQPLAQQKWAWPTDEQERRARQSKPLAQEPTAQGAVPAER